VQSIHVALVASKHTKRSRATNNYCTYIIAPEATVACIFYRKHPLDCSLAEFKRINEKQWQRAYCNKPAPAQNHFAILLRSSRFSRWCRWVGTVARLVSCSAAIVTSPIPRWLVTSRRDVTQLSAIEAAAIGRTGLLNRLALSSRPEPVRPTVSSNVPRFATVVAGGSSTTTFFFFIVGTRSSPAAASGSSSSATAASA